MEVEVEGVLQDYDHGCDAEGSGGAGEHCGCEAWTS